MAKRRRGQPAHQNPLDPLEGPISAQFDLHGMTASGVRAALQNFLLTAHGRHPGGLVHIITGKGLRSVGGPVLKGIVRKLLEAGAFYPVAAWAPDLDNGGYLIRLKP
jgi:DNA-nicking Smr family endonuclease